MGCEEARNFVKACLEYFVRDERKNFKIKTPDGTITIEEIFYANCWYLLGQFAEAFDHIRECRQEKCSQVWRELNLVIKTIEGTDLLVDDDGKLPFSC